MCSFWQVILNDGKIVNFVTFTLTQLLDGNQAFKGGGMMFDKNLLFLVIVDGTMLLKLSKIVCIYIYLFKDYHIFL